MLHILLWSVLIVIPKFFFPVHIKIYLVHEILLWIPIIIFFYINYFVLIPLLLTRRRFLLYSVCIAAMLLVSLFLGEIARPNNGFGQHINPMPPQIPMQSIRPKPDLFLPFRGLRNLTSCFLFLAIGTSIKVTEQWYSNEKQRKEMENQKLTAELSFLKSQINPHFFFNTLNSIYSLAISKSEKTPEAIIKLSELMRFIIYESEKNLVPLKRELDYISNYVELQRLRLMSNISVVYQIHGDFNNKEIEPLILLPFIENAFKHGIDSTKTCVISIIVVISEFDLLLIVENPIVQPSMKEKDESSGIGLSNSKKRLELIYAQNHQLKITRNDDRYRVELNIKFKEA
jgi:two-component system, LytTR family, sensor kinase